MHQSEVSHFQDVFDKMSAVFPGKRDSGLSATYFRALQSCDLWAVSKAAERLIASEKYFPKPAEWLEAVKETPKGDPLPEMPRDEMIAWLDAESHGFEAPFCECPACLSAGVSEKPIRFVPTIDRRGDVYKMAIGTREVLRGHWAHGDELARWYRARADFYEVALRIKLGHPLRDVVEEIR